MPPLDSQVNRCRDTLSQWLKFLDVNQGSISPIETSHKCSCTPISRAALLGVLGALFSRYCPFSSSSSVERVA